MVFKDRAHAGKELAKLLKDEINIKKHKQQCIVVSLIRGGVPVGHEISNLLGLPHYPLVVKKIGAPHQEELSIGAIVNGKEYLNKHLIKQLSLSDKSIRTQIAISRKKEKDYLKRFNIHKLNYKGKIAVLVDDGIATGSSVYAGALSIKINKPKEVYLACPVAPIDFDPYTCALFNSKKRCFDRAFIIYKDPHFFAVSQFYKKFDQLTDKEALSYYKK